MTQSASMATRRAGVAALIVVGAVLYLPALGGRAGQTAPSGPGGWSRPELYVQR